MCALVEFCVQKKYLLEIPELGGVSSWLDSLMKFQFSVNRANIHVVCLNPEIWWVFAKSIPVGLDLFLE